MANDFSKMDFFRGKELIADPYPYYESLRQQCPVAKEEHHGVTMVTGLLLFALPIGIAPKIILNPTTGQIVSTQASIP